MTVETLNPRLHAYRPDLADAALRGLVEAARFVAGEQRVVSVGHAPLRRAPRTDAPLDTEALAGEAVRVFEEQDGWAWAKLEQDGYVGYLPCETLRAPGAAPTHRVSAPATFLYPGPDLKFPPLDRLPMGAQVCVSGEAETRGTVYCAVEGGFIVRQHLCALDAFEADFVAVAERFIGVPYLWGGKTALGMDCSGLVQVAMNAAGRACPRDTDMQEGMGRALAGGVDAPLRRGDLVFWRGHVGIMSDPETLLHANGHHMATAKEPLRTAVERIAASSFGAVTSVRRMD